MTLLTLSQNVTDEIGIARPLTIIGNNNQDARRLLQATNRTGKELAKKRFVLLIQEHTFSSIANEDDYPLPTDFQFFIPETMWNRSNSWRTMGALDAREWQSLKSGLATTLVTDAFRIKAKLAAKRIFIDPTPSGVENFAFEYLSDAWVREIGTATDGQDQFFNAFTLDAQESLIDENIVELEVIWRMLRAMGEPYFDQRDEYDHQVSIAVAHDGAPRVLRFNRIRRRFDRVNVGETSFGL